MFISMITCSKTREQQTRPPAFPPHPYRPVPHSFLYLVYFLLLFFQNNSQNSTVQVTLYNTDARLQVPVICTYINSFIISAGYSSSGYHAAMATASSPHG